MKKLLLVVVSALIFVLAACSSSEKAENISPALGEGTKVINLGIQQALSPLWVAKEQGLLEDAFKEIGVEVAWTEFQSGPPQFEGIAAGKLDITEVGNTPPLSAQAAGIDFKEIGVLSAGETSNAVLLPASSTIKSVKDLEGKKVAVAKGSSAFGLLYAAFEKEGIDPAKVEVIQLQPDEARPAFENGAVDAWATWEPFVSNQVVNNNATVLVDGKDVGTYATMFSIARTDFLTQNADLVDIYFKVYKEAAQWVQDNPEEAVQFFADLKEIDPAIVEAVLTNAPYEIQAISDEVIGFQQSAADLFVKQQVFTNSINVQDVVENQYVEKLLKGAE